MKIIQESMLFVDHLNFITVDKLQTEMVTFYLKIACWVNCFRIVSVSLQNAYNIDNLCAIFSADCHVSRKSLEVILVSLVDDYVTTWRHSVTCNQQTIKLLLCRRYLTSHTWEWVTSAGTIWNYLTNYQPFMQIWTTHWSQHYMSFVSRTSVL